MDQLARPRTLVAHDLTGGAVQVPKARDAVTASIACTVEWASPSAQPVRWGDPVGCPVVEKHS